MLGRGYPHKERLVLNRDVVESLSRLRELAAESFQLVAVGIDEVNVAGEACAVVLAHAVEVGLQLAGVINDALVAEVDLDVARDVKFVLRAFFQDLLAQLVQRLAELVTLVLSEGEAVLQLL